MLDIKKGEVRNINSRKVTIACNIPQCCFKLPNEPTMPRQEFLSMVDSTLTMYLRYCIIVRHARRSITPILESGNSIQEGSLFLKWELSPCLAFTWNIRAWCKGDSILCKNCRGLIQRITHLIKTSHALRRINSPQQKKLPVHLLYLLLGVKSKKHSIYQSIQRRGTPPLRGRRRWSFEVGWSVMWKFLHYVAAWRGEGSKEWRGEGEASRQFPFKELASSTWSCICKLNASTVSRCLLYSDVML